MPDIFSSTPIEGYILTLFWRVQLQLAGMMAVTPVFRAALFVGLMWAIALGFLRMASERHHHAKHFFHMVYRAALVFLSLACLTQASTATLGSSKGLWSSRPGVAGSPVLGPALNGPGQALLWYLLPFQAMNQLGNSMKNAAATVFNTDPATMDPRFLPRQLARMSKMTLGPQAAGALDALDEQCVDQNYDTFLSEPYTQLQDMYDLTTPECAQMFGEMQAAVARDADALVQWYPPDVWRAMQQKLVEVVPAATALGIPPAQTLKNMAVASAMQKYLADKAGFSAQTINGQQDTIHNVAATFTDGRAELGGQIVAGEGIVGAAAANVATMLGYNARSWGMKAQAANMFDNISSLIPTIRAFVQGILALLFVIAAYSVGFGSWKFMMAWLYAQAMACLYTPVAALGYKVAEYFHGNGQFAEYAQRISNSPLIYGGAKVLQDQMDQIQTTYLLFEVGVFGIFLLGAIAAFGPASRMTSTVGSAVMGGYASFAGQAATMAGNLWAGAAGAASAQGRETVTVNVNGSPHSPQGGGARTPPALARAGGFARALEEHPTTSAPGVITPSDSVSPSRRNWPDAA